MRFEWDRNKAKANLQKHGVAFPDVIPVFVDPFALTLPGDLSDEPRSLVIGMDALARVVVVVYTRREDAIRIISARKATSREAEQYAP